MNIPEFERTRGSFSSPRAPMCITLRELGTASAEATAGASPEALVYATRSGLRVPNDGAELRPSSTRVGARLAAASGWMRRSKSCCTSASDAPGSSFDHPSAGAAGSGANHVGSGTCCNVCVVKASWHIWPSAGVVKRQLAGRLGPLQLLLQPPPPLPRARARPTWALTLRGARPRPSRERVPSAGERADAQRGWSAPATKASSQAVPVTFA